MVIRTKAPLRVASWVLFAVLVAPPVFVELVLAMPASPLVYLAYAAFAALMQFYLIDSVRRRVRLVQLALLTVGLLVLHYVPWTSRKVFLADFNRIEPGMTIEEAHSLVAPHSRNADLQTGDIVRGYTHSRHPRFDADIGVVYFSNGRVREARFLWD